ncbi:MAG: hypothetical protein ACE5EM_05705 [Sphingomonadales bacterium]
MSDPKTTKRTAPISYRPPEAWRDELYARQQASGLSMNAFITKALFGAPVSRGSRRPPLEAGELARLLNHAARIRHSLDEIAQNTLSDAGDESASDPKPCNGVDHDACNGGRKIAQLIAAAQEDIATLRSAILKAMGRAP